MPRSKQEPLIKFYNDNSDLLEIGVDEAGRGPLFGRVYTAAVILPKEDGGNGCEAEKKVFDYHKMKDSKKFTSSKKILEVAEHIKANALAWSVTYNDEITIDKINIRQSVLSSMHQSIKNVMDTYNNVDTTGTEAVANVKEYFLLIDGNDFKPYLRFQDDHFVQVNHTCIEGGDNKYCAIAAASILAKTERDKYIEELCDEHPELKEKYGLEKNKGYGTKQHLDGIKEHGISKWHRKTYGICKEYC
jgi:ribonuclease HII